MTPSGITSETLEFEGNSSSLDLSPATCRGDECSLASAYAEVYEAAKPRILPPARVIVCGGRDYSDRKRVFSVLDCLHAARPFAMIFHGNARGADTLADLWCKLRGVGVFAVPAQWAKHGKRAGPLRNQAMLGHGIDLVVAFPGGAGTEDMVRRAHKAGVLVTLVRAATPLGEAA
jgi:hypothetical protein